MLNKKYIILSILLGSCAAQADVSPNRIGHSFRIAYDVKDVPSDGKIYVSFHNDTKNAICLGPENWPDNGVLLNDGTTVSLTVDNTLFFLKSNQDYCLKCSKRINPGMKSVDFFTYQSFSLPASLSGFEKKLTFYPVAFRCQ